jgi:D-serine deaminase-like pyridoxal phosphate-dependent protein
MAKAVANGAYICFMADLEVHLDLLNEAGKKHQIQLPVCLDIDMSSDYGPLHFGVWRSRIGNIQCLEAVLKHLSGLDYLRLDGIMGYEAQVAGLGDKLKGQALKNSVVQWLKQKSVKKARRLRQEAVDLIASMGFDLRFVNGGGTGSAETTTLESAVTEITIGSGFYTPHLFDYYQAFSLSPALFYGIQVVRQPKDGMYTCHGGGFTASGGVAPIKAPVVYLPQGGKLLSTEGAGEVQTPIVFDKTTNLQIGDPVFLRHAKAGELCEHFNHLYLLDGDQLRTVPTYRGEGQAFG